MAQLPQWIEPFRISDICHAAGIRRMYRNLSGGSVGELRPQRGIESRA
ncbi:hypothetical protein SDC9_195065 [bioreactor metagenome]|uniref:Uncharacterized protein n=1 Tax=bioreactor metagenome TaxID=1076179 RepID=A0A645IJF9_9ZZZZ